VLRGAAPLVGARLDPEGPSALVSPVEARLAMGIPYDDVAAEERRYLAARTPKSDAGVLARAAIAAAIGGGSEAREAPARAFVVSAPVDLVTIGEALDRIFAEAPLARAKMVHFVHPHALNLATSDRDLARAFADADLVLPDGVGLRLAGRALGAPVPHNVNGTDLLPLLCLRAARDGVPIAMIGAAPGVAATCRDKLVARFPGLDVRVVEDGFLGEDGARRVAARLAEMPGAIALVGMGSPLQERWAWTHLARVPGITVVTVGGLFDFYAERLPRAPLAWRELGLEWLFRFLQEPRRLAKRYFVGNPVFVARVVAQRARG
jgi:N-acetylglucosaminyldiphosphoundecaprenol N-acetyl-beta-D-mannosaminyltransferase